MFDIITLNAQTIVLNFWPLRDFFFWNPHILLAIVDILNFTQLTSKKAINTHKTPAVYRLGNNQKIGSDHLTIQRLLVPVCKRVHSILILLQTWSVFICQTWSFTFQYISLSSVLDINNINNHPFFLKPCSHVWSIIQPPWRWLPYPFCAFCHAVNDPCPRHKWISVGSYPSGITCLLCITCFLST